MFTLLNYDDKYVLQGSSFAKNAVFYKDMLCFCNAFENLVKNKEKLPNFCFKKQDELCLEGLCLLMKMYATEFQFETLKLSLDYLKILYYAAASYAEYDIVNPDIIIKEFNSYKDASENYCAEQESKVLEKKKELHGMKKELKEKTKKILSQDAWSKALKITAWILLSLSAVSVIAPVLVMANYTTKSTAFVMSIILVVLGFVISVACFIIGKRLKLLSDDLSHHVLNLKKNIEQFENEFIQLQAKYYRVFCEKYEYSMYFAEIFTNFVKTLSLDEILEKANDYKLVSYNIVYDINRLFKSQQRETDLIVARLERISASEDYQEEFARIYDRIIEQDWLYYNAEVRYHFLKKFSDISEHEHNWKLSYKEQKINPFDVDVKALSREAVAFTKANDSKLIKSTVAELIQTKYFKSIEDLNFKNGYSVDALKRVKANYLSHFYNMEVLDTDKSFFFDKKTNTKLVSKAIPLDKISKIPTLVNLKLKLIEGSTGLGNSDAKVIKTIASTIFTDYVKEEFDNLNFREEDIDYPKFTASKIEKTENEIIYYVGDEVVVGRRLKKK